MNTILDSNYNVQYTPARIVNESEVYIIFYAWHPIYNKLWPKKMRFNHLRSKMTKTALDKHIRKIAHDVNINLALGKNPFIGAEISKGYEKLTDAISLFLTVKEKEMRADGFRSYRSYCKKLVNWLEKKKLSDIYVIHFTEDLAVEFMDMVELDPKLGTKSYNNHFVFFRSLWYWLLKKKYCKENVFLNFKKKKETEKFREVIPVDNHKIIMEWCRENHPRFEIIIDLVRSAFIRPAELCRIKIGNISLAEKVIKIPEADSKTHNFRFAYLPEWLILKMIDVYELDRYPLSYYFISKGLEPGLDKWDTRDIDKIWSRMRTDTGIGKKMQLYSYRDTGITALENKGVPESVIRQLTDHKSDRMIRKYIRKPSQELIDNVVTQIKE